jgi:hypothetical protein
MLDRIVAVEHLCGLVKVREKAMTGPAIPKVVTRNEWERARVELLVREKVHARAGDELAAARRRLSMTPMDPVTQAGNRGCPPSDANGGMADALDCADCS